MGVHLCEWKSVYLSERDNIKGNNASSGLSVTASWEAFANEKNIEPDCGAAADNKLNNVNNTNHPHNRGSNKAGVNRTTNLKWRLSRSLFLSSPS